MNESTVASDGRFTTDEVATLSALVEDCAAPTPHMSIRTSSIRTRIGVIEPRMISFQFKVRDGCSQAYVVDRNLHARSRLLALVFRPIHHSHYTPHHFNVKATIRGNTLDRVRILYIIFQHRVEDLVGGQ